MKIYIGEKGKKNGEYQLFISRKLSTKAHTWIERSDETALKVYNLVLDYELIMSTPKALPEQLSLQKNIRDRQTELRIEYSRLPDDLKNSMLLDVIEHYQNYI